MRDNVFVSYLNYAPLIDLAGLGMDIHDNVGNDPAWDNGLSWELVPSLGADLVIWDDRPRFLKPEDLSGHPIWQSLPAVQAGQIVGYAFDAPLSYGFMSRQYQAITEAVRAARTDLV
jgi:iron complex transport system substrate-binding protein